MHFRDKSDAKNMWRTLIVFRALGSLFCPLFGRHSGIFAHLLCLSWVHTEIFNMIESLMMRKQEARQTNEVVAEGLALISKFLLLEEMKAKIPFTSISSVIMKTWDYARGKRWLFPLTFRLCATPFGDIQALDKTGRCNWVWGHPKFLVEIYCATRPRQARGRYYNTHPYSFFRWNLLLHSCLFYA